MKTQTMSNNSFTLKNGLTIAYYDSAPDKQLPVVVLLHGYCGSSSYFQELTPLLGRSCRVITPDLIGHGASASYEQDTYALQEQAQFMIEWLDGIAVSSAVMLGHSLGGYITLAVAEQKPSFLSAFGLLHSTALPDSEQAKQNREQAIRTVQEQGVQSFVDGLVPKLIAADHPQRAALIEIASAIGYSTTAAAVSGYARGMKERPDRTLVIEETSLPVLLISGAKDAIVSSENTFAGRNASTECHIIAEAGHMGMLEAPQQLAAIIEKFISTKGETID
ncbi:alpha/beta fold hydrolase [Paenibacillus camelliae]|uniref:alpha/beta fold hydrolase n=1 Tax=Paenibacillus camelliae TaxID=512410 RepID=UPI00203FAC3E|nr:alpha/beta hydrolase [Paenibacillus camelliae]MCM3633810.1 alpha/beta hydrolase [Paenibacillus camelliae]